MMRALTILQPAAHLIATGRKRVENRTWPTSYRGTLAIHAGKGRGALEAGDLERYAGMTFGAVVAVAELVDCIPIEGVEAGDYDRRYPWLRRHEHARGPWCFVLANVRRLSRPVPWRGTLGLFNLPDDLLRDAPVTAASRR